MTETARAALQVDHVLDTIRTAQDKIRLVKRGNARWYELLIADAWERVPGVTSPLAVLAKPALPFWAANLQFDADILTAWEAQLSGISFLGLDDFDSWFRTEAPAKKAHVEALRKACEIGTGVHDLIENNLRERLGLEPKPCDVSDDARFVYEGFNEWADGVNLRPLMTESRLASFRHRYAGTMDSLALVEMDDELTLLDWKTSKAVYPEMRLQNVGYRKAVEEMTGILPAGMLVRLPKDRGEIEPVRLNDPARDDVDRLFGVFLNLLAIYPWAKEHGPLEDRRKK